MYLFENSSTELTLAAVVTCVSFFALLLLRVFVTRQLQRITASGHAQFLIYPAQIVGATRLPFIFVVSLLAGVSQLDLPLHWDKCLHYAWIIVLVTQIAMWCARIVSIAAQHAFDEQRESNPAGATHLILAGLIGRIAIWLMAILIMLDNFGFNISTLMASLGIGGIAVALAVQNILGDVFSSISIALDKPFVIGDFIVLEDYVGTVEYVGMKTTRLRSLGGEQIIISNSELLKNRIRNYKRMQERRIFFEFGITYETSIENIEAIPTLLQEIISSQALGARFDRAHFKSYGDSALLYEVVYYVLDPDYNRYMDIQQSINVSLMREFRKRDITFAYPTRTLYFTPSTADAKGGIADKSAA